MDIQHALSNALHTDPDLQPSSSLFHRVRQDGLRKAYATAGTKITVSRVWQVSSYLLIGDLVPFFSRKVCFIEHSICTTCSAKHSGRFHVWNIDILISSGSRWHISSTEILAPLGNCRGQVTPAQLHQRENLHRQGLATSRLLACFTVADARNS